MSGIGKDGAGYGFVEQVLDFVAENAAKTWNEDFASGKILKSL